MKKDFSRDSFEQFLKEAADDVRMQPMVNVWSRIEARMNRRRRWVFFTSAFFLLTASVFGYLIIDHSKNTADPFAAVQTIQKPVATENAKSGAATSGTASASALQQPGSQKATQNQSRNQLPNTSATRATTTELFQKPMLQENSAIDAIAVADIITPAVDEYEPFTASTPAVQQPQKAAHSDVPTIESVLNSFKPKGRKYRSEFQLYFTPTVSYRRLTENKSYLRAVPQNMATFNVAALYDVNSMVTHKPDLGLELGFAFKFPVSSRIKLRTGMQFNITRYDIKAFTYVPERTTIALNTRSRGRVDSVNTISSYRNFNGGRSDWIQNFYFQVSTPVGVEVASSTTKKTRVGVAATIQPTYVLGDRAYLISADYKNYSQVPWLIRRWNANTSMEAFVSYSTGKLRWQVGPQVRYQLLSSFVEKYPVKENLFDYGLKIGVSLDKK
jgi:hypothetical protein